MKRLMLVVLCVLLLAVGGVSAYYYFNIYETPQNDYQNGMFVDRGEDHGYATMYDLFETL